MTYNSKHANEHSKEKKNHICPTEAKPSLKALHIMKTLYFPVKELEAQRQEVTSPQLLSSQENSEQERQSKNQSQRPGDQGSSQ